MAKYKSKYKAGEEFESAVAEHHRDLYEQRGEEMLLIGFEGMKTEADVSRVQTALEKERGDHKTTRANYNALLGGRDHETALAIIDGHDELKAQFEAAKKPDDERINTLVEARIKSRLTPLERERDALKTRAAELENENVSFKKDAKTRRIHSALDLAMKGGQDGKGPKVLDVAREDVLLAAERVFDETEDGNIATKDGIDPVAWLYDVAPKKPHWFPPAEGGGSKGPGNGGGSYPNNPWSKGHWNKTEQGAIYKENPQRAEQMAKAAGSSITAVHPPQK